MNITRLNFAQSLPFIRSTLQAAHYLAFDLEMSGIMTQQLTSPSLADSIQKRYEKQRQSVSKFIPLQFGLAAFKVLPEQRKILAQPFNFYIFPLTQQQQIMKFSFHAGTMNFLTKNNFDFNKLLYEGVAYTSRQKMKELSKNTKLDEIKLELRRLKQMKSPQTQAFLKINMPLVQQWMRTAHPELQINIQFIKYQSYMSFKDKVESQYPQQSLTFDFDHQQVIKRSKMTIKKSTAQHKLDGIEMDCAVEPDKLFNEVIDQMIALQKPIIVHNGFLDLMHVYYRFIGDLPDNWYQYKQKVHSLFPTIYDNKYLFAHSPYLNHQLPNRQTGLENCFTRMRQMEAKQAENRSQAGDHSSILQNTQPMKFQFAEEFKQYKQDSLACHEAGYDAFMTGYSFLKGITHLGIMKMYTDDDLNKLTNPKTFSQQHQLIRNRIPQGNIKVPFNFEGNQQDIYIKDGSEPLFFKSLYNEVVSQAQLLQFFTKTYGPVNILWASREMTQFCIFFVNKQAKQKYQQRLTQNKAANTITADLILGVQFLVFTREQHQRTMNNFINNAIAETEKF